MLASDVAHTAGTSHPHDMLAAMVFAIFGGILLIIIARRLNLPAIVLLLAGGVILGPEVLGLFDPESLGDGLPVIVSFAVGLILFEGGLTLDMTGYRAGSQMIKRLLTFGVMITWFGTALTIWLIFGLGEDPMLSRAECILAGSLVIVTGPTVIAPLLKRIKVTSRLHNILHWEGVLIDPIGVFIALLCFEWVVGPSGAEAFASFLIRIAAGLGCGIAGGFAISAIVRTRLIPQDMFNVFALGSAVGIFGAAEFIEYEAGLLSVTVAGFIFGLRNPGRLKQIKRFKAELTDLLIGTLFILLAARLEFNQFAAFGWKGALVVAIIILVIRPLNVYLCSLGSDLGTRDKLFLSWVAPRGIVAASMASLIQLSLSSEGDPNDPRFIETFTYSVIITTVVLQGLSAGWVAKVLGLRRPVPTGWLIVGSHALGRRLASFIAKNPNSPAVLVDTNARAVRGAQNEGLTAFVGDARDITLYDRPELQGVGSVLAITDNEDLNQLVCQRWSEVVGANRVFRCTATSGEIASVDEEVANGIAIWSRIPRPSVLSAELIRHEASMIASTMPIESMRGKAIPLATMNGDQVVLDPQESDTTANGDATSNTLYLKREGDYLLRAIHADLVTTSHADELTELFKEMIGLIVRRNPALPRDDTVAELIDRETTFPTALGHGIAVPHAYSHSLDSRVCGIARVPAGIDFKSADGEPVNLVFLLLSPEGDPEGHLATLAEIARLVVNEEFRAAMIDAPSPIDVIETIRTECGAS
ncbi:MAG: cation:proton antiporter [Planctomycetota bacterium]